MSKIIDSDISVTLVDMTPVQMETLLGGCCQSSHTPFLSNLPEIINNAKKPTTGSADNKYTNQKINTIDNSKKTYLNGVVQPNGKPIIIHD